MPRVDAETLLVWDGALQLCGALVLVGFILHLVRSGRWRNPLADVTLTGDGPLFLHFVALVGAYLLALACLQRLLAAFWSPLELQAAGSNAWHWMLAAEGGLRLLVAASGAAVLWTQPTFPRARLSPERLRYGTGVVVAATLASVPVCMLQLNMLTVLWRWLFPESPPPVHPALQALEQSEWGAWGAVEVFISAVVLAALAEEILFRGVLLGSVLGQTGLAWPAILLSALFFGFVHLTAGPQTVLPLISLGLILGYLRVRTRSLAVCVGVHALFNARTMILALLNPDLIRYGY